MSDELTRYDPICDCGSAGLCPSDKPDSGEWVRYDDVVALRERVRSLEVAIQALKDAGVIRFTFMDGSRQSDLSHPVAAANNALAVLSKKAPSD